MSAKETPPSSSEKPEASRLTAATAEEATDGSTASEHGATFVDYVALPEVRVQPPAKYKLWILVWTCVYVASLFASEANLYQALRLRGWLSPNASLFFMLALIVFVMVYAALDLAVALGTVSYKGKSYGLGPWLKSGRAKWMYKYSEHNLLVQILATVVWKLEDGFSMFDTAPRRPPSNRTHVRGKRRSKHPHYTRSQTSSSSGSSLSPTASNHIHQTQAWESAGGRSRREYEFEEEEAEADLFHCESEDCKVLLKIEHRIDPTKLEEYAKWKDKIRRAIRQQRGLLDITCGDVTTDMEPSTPTTEGDNGTVDLEAAAESPPRSSTYLHVVYCTFSNIGYLNEWLLSPRRKILMKELSPLLIHPDLVQIQKDRVLPDALTDLVVAQGQCAPSMPPKKWKVWWLTTLALFVTIRWSRSFMAYYYDFWGLTNPHLQSLVGTAVSTLLNSYVMVPLALFLFNPWMQRHADEKDEREPWRTFDDGIQNLWMKALLTSIFYGGCAIAWIVKSTTNTT